MRPFPDRALTLTTLRQRQRAQDLQRRIDRSLQRIEEAQRLERLAVDLMVEAHSRLVRLRPQPDDQDAEAMRLRSGTESNRGTAARLVTTALGDRAV